MTRFSPLKALSMLLLVGALHAGACQRGETTPRPVGLPSEAFWLGGPDGGAFLILIAQPGDSGRRVTAKVFHENGSAWYDGPLILKPQNVRGVDLSDHSILAGWDGERLLLTEGRTFVAPPRP